MDPYSLLQAFRRKARSARGRGRTRRSPPRHPRRITRRVRDPGEGAGRSGRRAVVNAAGASGVKEIADTVGIDPSHRVAQGAARSCSSAGSGSSRSPSPSCPKGSASGRRVVPFSRTCAPPPGVGSAHTGIPTSTTACSRKASGRRSRPACRRSRRSGSPGAWCCHYDFNTPRRERDRGDCPGAR